MLEKIANSDPQNKQAQLLLANTYLRAGDNKKVIALLDPVLSVASAEPAFAYVMGTALIRDNQVERGQMWLDRVLKNGDSAETRLLLGTAKMMANDLPGARADLTKAVELNPKLPEAHAYLGLTLMRSGDTAEAANAFRKELEIEPNNFEANLQLGGLLRQEDHTEEARTMLARALGIRPGDFGARYQIAAIDLAQGRLDDARSSLETVVKEAPEFVEAHVTLATVYYRLKRKEDGDREREVVRKLNAAAQAKQTERSSAEASKP